MKDNIEPVIDEMLEVKNLIARYKFEMKELEQKEELLNVKLIAYLQKKGVDEVILPNCYFGNKVTSRTAFDQKLFSQENPELFEKYKTTKEKESFEFKIGVKK